MRRTRWLIPPIFVAMAACAGCFQGRYLTQAAAGQVRLTWAAQPIDEVLADRDTPAHVRALLSEVGAIKTFGERRGLKATKNYRQYAALDRDAVAWAVTACAPLSFDEKLWWFPI